ncbi:MAG: lasso peptide biosynthesis B2 protein [Candidatus Dadabacteria bacterium]|nr:lasso peptide biosynthesis B2 protein [Candidatus Dadabacteria bacterium]NIV42239.1 lasso peptide biosynthesis B2 protein [Candidatus Dadabacteria bacterium]NIX15331.1 lasso peptide biosynthesis B2 protein [Candidatus Dadabacteria bacterium]
MDKIKKLFNHFDSFGDVLLFFQIVLFLTILPLLLKIFSLKRLMELLSSESKEEQRLKQAGKVLELTNLILYRDFWIYKNVCLKRSLTLYYFLSKMGQDVNIYYGVKKGENPNEY